MFCAGWSEWGTTATQSAESHTGLSWFAVFALAEVIGRSVWPVSAVGASTLELMTIFAFGYYPNSKYTVPQAHSYLRFSVRVSNAAHFSLNLLTDSHTHDTTFPVSKTLNYHLPQTCDYSEVSEIWSLCLSSRQREQSELFPSPYPP
jgi:hypothetical protein